MVTITYLEMLDAPGRPPAVAPEGVTIEHVAQPTVEQYRYLYDRVGSDWRWLDRRVLSDDELRDIITHSNVDIYLLRVDGEAAGYAELDRRVVDEIQLQYFGLFPEYIGRGLGAF